MLLNLHVKNLAIIEEVDIDFSKGFNVLTGETGAGKSIILGSINLALGAKVSKDIIRNGASFALVELVFSYTDNKINEILSDNDIEINENIITVTRKITATRSVSKINGESANLNLVHEIAGYLIDIHGQHDNKLLIDSSEHINILDSFIGNEAKLLLNKISVNYNEYISVKRELSKLNMDVDKRLREIALLEYEINEIETAKLKKDEDVSLEEDFKLMSNMESIVQTMSSVVMIAGNECLDGISRAARMMNKIAGISDDIDSIYESLSQTESMLSDVIRDLESYLENNQFNQTEFEQIESRLDKINMFKAKYGPDIESIQEYCKSNKERLELLTNSEEYIKKLNLQLSELEDQIEADCDCLSELRKEKAKELCKGITESLKNLNFNDAEFDMIFERKDSFSSNGKDNAQFIIKSNKGEDYKPLSKIASGGELSRVMLAIKTVIADTQQMDSFIFDEIDAGISGRTAQMVAQQLAKLSNNRQIICITHLAQLASMADVNYVIEKNVQNEHTFTNIRQIEDEEITNELARIIGGAQITDTVIDSAVEMKKLANEYKQKIG